MPSPFVLDQQKANLAAGGFLFGLCFPVVGTFVECARLGTLSLDGLWAMQTTTPLLWIIDTAPLILALAGSLIANKGGSSLKGEKQMLPLLVSGLLVPLLLVLFALVQETKTARIVSDVNLSGALRYHSVRLFVLTNDRKMSPAWRPEWERMKQTLADLRQRYPRHMALTDSAWENFSRQLQTRGRVDWASAEEMRAAADDLTSSLEASAHHDQNLLVIVVTLGIISLLISSAKSYDLLRQIRLARLAQQESEYRFKKLGEASFEGIALSQDGIVITANHQFCSMFGYDLHEVCGMRGEAFIVQEQREELRTKIQEQDEKPYEIQGLRRDGTTFPLQVEAKTVQYQGAIARVTAVRDLSERVRIETELREANERLYQMANRDELTGLYNRRAFNHHLQLELDRAKRHHTPLSLLLLDVDKFKSINDGWGHDYGDEVLKRVSHIVQDATRPSDCVARYGGEELFIVLPHTDRHGALCFAERCRQAIEDALWSHGRVTASFGVATLDSTLFSAEELIEAADKALYFSKQEGRNRVTHCEHLLAPTIN